MNRAILGTSFGGGRENGGNEPAAERRDEKLDDTSIVVQLVPAVSNVVDSKAVCSAK